MKIENDVWLIFHAARTLTRPTIICTSVHQCDWETGKPTIALEQTAYACSTETNLHVNDVNDTTA